MPGQKKLKQDTPVERHTQPTKKAAAKKAPAKKKAEEAPAEEA